MNGKGDGQRPAQVSDKEVQDNWDKIFGGKLDPKGMSCAEYVKEACERERLKRLFSFVDPLPESVVVRRFPKLMGEWPEDEYQERLKKQMRV